MTSRKFKTLCAVSLSTAITMAAVAGYAQSASSLVFSSDIPQGARVPWTRVPTAVSTPDFSFAIFGDRTGMAYPGGFDRAVREVNANSQSSEEPSFVRSIGDNIEGYTSDAAVLTKMWDQFDDSAKQLSLPFIRVPGNHDISDETMRQVYESRYGRPYFYFLYEKVLFLGLDTEDPPPPISAEKEQEANATILRLAAQGTLHPDQQVIFPGQPDPCDAEATHAALGSLAETHISDGQLEYFTQVLREHPNVRWTYLFMHRPPWRNPRSANFAKLQNLLAGRDYTVFAGHYHQYSQETIQGHDYYILGPTAALPRCIKSDVFLNQVVTVQFDGRHSSVTRALVHEH